MLFPKEIVEFVENDPYLRDSFSFVFSQDSNARYDHETVLRFYLWMETEGVNRSVCIKRYIFYVHTLLEIFNRIYYFFEKKNQGRENKKDHCSIATSLSEMLCIAQYLYALNSYGIKGDILECGCFKGFSSCCLSWVCSMLGRKLIIADSFEGLPSTTHLFYQKGDYTGSLEDVRDNIISLGRLDAVEFLTGFYKKSLVGFDRQISILWMDVDLPESIVDIMGNVIDSLCPGGIIFCHEFNFGHIKEQKIISDQDCAVPTALRKFLEDKKIKYQIKFLIDHLAVLFKDIEIPLNYFKAMKLDILEYALYVVMNNDSLLQKNIGLERKIDILKKENCELEKNIEKKGIELERVYSSKSWYVGNCLVKMVKNSFSSFKKIMQLNRR